MKKQVHFSEYMFFIIIISYNLKDLNKEVFFLKIFFLDDNFLVGIMKLHIERCFSSKQTEFSETRQLNIVAFYPYLNRSMVAIKLVADARVLPPYRDFLTSSCKATC